MKHVTKQLFSIAMLVSVFAINAASTSDVHASRSVGPAFRSNFSGNGLVQQANRCCGDSEGLNAQLSAGIEYAQSFGDKLATYFTFGDKATIQFGTEGATTTEIFSVNFFLPHNHVSTLTFNPKFSMLNADLRLHLGLNDLVEGLWFNVDLPIVHAKYDLGLTKSVTTAGATTSADGTFGGANNGATYPYADPILALHGDKTITDANTIVTAPLSYGKFGTAEEGTKTKVGNVLLALGYNLVDKDDAQLGIAALGVVNGDERSDAKFVNEARIGTGGHHGFGGRVDGSVRLWENNVTAFSAHLRADLAYILNATERRSFDFTTNGTMSRYLLVNHHTDFNSTNKITNAINVTSLQVKVGKYLLYDINAMFSVTHNEWEMNVGYNLVGQSKEKFGSFVESIPSTATSAYVFYSYANAPVGNIAANATHAPAITISGATNTQATLADDAALAANAITNTSLNQASGLQPESMSHRIYGNLGYCYDKNEWMPSLSAGASVTLAADNKSVRTWGVHGTLGICF